MNIIVYLVIGFALVFSAIGYLLYTQYAKRTTKLYYWRQGNRNNRVIEQMKNEFREEEQIGNAYKAVIGFAVQGRNMVRKIWDEINSLLRQKGENISIRYIDVQLVANYKESVMSIINGIKLLNEEKKLPVSDSLYKKTVALQNKLSALLQRIDPLLKPLEKKRDELDFLRSLSEETEAIYNEIVKLHEILISDFQAFFSGK